MRPAVRIALVVVGIGAVVCGASWLTGRWLPIDLSHDSIERVPLLGPHDLHGGAYGFTGVRHDGVFEAVVLIGVGVSLAAFGAWRQRRRPTGTT